MDPCNPAISLADKRLRVKFNFGLEESVVNKMTSRDICDAYHVVRKTPGPLPPMNMSVFDGSVYYTDGRAPLKPPDYEALFGRASTLEQLLKISKKLGLTLESATKKEIKTNIISFLKTKHFLEPIKISMKVRASANLGTPSNLRTPSNNLGPSNVGPSENNNSRRGNNSTPSGAKYAGNNSLPSGTKYAWNNSTPSGTKYAWNNSMPSGAKYAWNNSTPGNTRPTRNNSTPGNTRPTRNNSTPGNTRPAPGPTENTRGNTSWSNWWSGSRPKLNSERKELNQIVNTRVGKNVGV